MSPGDVNPQPAGHRHPVVTLAALYGAGGSVVGPRVAERLGVPFLDRAIPAEVARRAGLREEAVAAVDQQPRSRADRLMRSMASISLPGATTAMQVRADEQVIIDEIDAFITAAAETGGVLLGRGGAIALREMPQALHVYLRGTREARLEHAMTLEGIDRETAQRRQRANDQARRDYVRRRYGADGEDPEHYHLALNAIRLGIETTVDVIVAASEALIRRTEADTRSGPAG